LILYIALATQTRGISHPTTDTPRAHPTSGEYLSPPLGGGTQPSIAQVLPKAPDATSSHNRKACLLDQPITAESNIRIS